LENTTLTRLMRVASVYMRGSFKDGTEKMPCFLNLPQFLCYVQKTPHFKMAPLQNVPETLADITIKLIGIS
jgi:hypothetical protein